MNRSNLMALACRHGLHAAARGVDIGHLLMGKVIRQRIGLVLGAAEEVEIENVHRDAAGPNRQRAVGVRLAGDIVGQVAVLDDHQPAVNVHHVAHLLQRVALGNHLAGHLRVGEDVIADVFGPGDIDQGIVDLEVEQLPDAAGLGVGHGAALGKRGQHAAVAVGAHGQAIGRFQQELARCRIDRRHRALAEDVQVFFGHPEAVMRGEETERLLVRRRTGHQVERYPHPVPLGRGQDLFDMNLKQGSAGDGADRKHALGMVKPQAGPLPSGDQDHADLPGRQGLMTPAAGFRRREPVLRCVQPEGRRLGAARKARSRKLPWSCRCAYSFWISGKSIPRICRASDSRCSASKSCPKSSADVPARTAAGLLAGRRCSTTTSP